jgi:hypothetical protein
MRKFVSILSFGVFFAGAVAAQELPRVAGEPAWPNAKAAALITSRSANYAAADTAQVRFKSMAQARIDEVRANNSRPNVKVLQVGIHREMRTEAESTQPPALVWKALPDGGQVARFAVTSPGAKALRLGLNVAGLPAGAELSFFDASGGNTAVAMTTGSEIKTLRREQPVYWTPVTEGETQIVEVYLPAGSATNTFRFSIDSISHLIVLPSGKLDGAKIGESASCERDVSCMSPMTTGFTNAKNSVARMVFTAACGSGGALASCLCTGTLLNDTDTATQTPYFYGANHCISTQTEASTLSTFWFYESTGCGMMVLNSGNKQVTGGADLLYNNAAQDALLLRLRQPPPAGAYFLGWDPNTLTASSDFTVIHHPSGDVKKVSLGKVFGFTTLTNLGGSFIHVGYNSASTEGGSSGAALMTADSSGAYYLRGGLYGGAASCSDGGNLNAPDNYDDYSRFDQVYPSISQYLNPIIDYTGGWNNPNENGWGVSIIRGPSSGLYVIVMYHYNQVSNPTWYWMTGGSFSGNTYTTDVRLFSGPWFGQPTYAPQGTSTIVGTATINFTSATTGTITYTIDGKTVSKSINKFIF